MSQVFRTLRRVVANLLAEMVAYIVGIFALVAGLFVWTFTSSAYAGLAAAVLGLLIAGWVSTLAYQRTERSRSESD